MTWPDDDCRRCQRREDNLEAELARREAEIGAAWEALPDDVAGDYSTLADAIRAALNGRVAFRVVAEADSTLTPDPLFGETLIPHPATTREWRDGYGAGVRAERQQQAEEIEHRLSVAHDMLPVASGKVRQSYIGYIAALTDIRDAYDSRERDIERDRCRPIDGAEKPAGNDDGS